MKRHTLHDLEVWMMKPLNDGNALYSNPHRKTCLLLWGLGTKTTSKSDGERQDLVSLTYRKIP